MVFGGEIKEDWLKRFGYLGVGEHGFYLIDGAEADFEMRVLFGGCEMATGLAAPGFGEIGGKNRDSLEVMHCKFTK